MLRVLLFFASVLSIVPPAHGQKATLTERGTQSSQVATSCVTDVVGPVPNDGLAVWQQSQQVLASDGAGGDKFGFSVAISGSTAVVGAYDEDELGDNAGAAYVFERGSDGQWQGTKKLTANDGAAKDAFGERVAISGDYIIVGARGADEEGLDAGAAYLFSRNSGGSNNWGQVQKLLATDAAIEDAFGTSVGISGNYAIVGAPETDEGGTDAGAAYLFERDSGGADNWGQVRKLRAVDAQVDDQFGHSVAISGDYVIVGAHEEDTGSSDAGAAYLFERNSGGSNAWGQVTKIQASDAATNDNFGHSVAITDDHAVVGAYKNDDAGTSSGAAYVFGRAQGGADNWGQVSKLVADNAASGDNFGRDVAVSGELILVGAARQDGGASNTGAAYVFQRHQGGTDQWGQVQQLRADVAVDGDQFGSGVALSGGYAIIGAHFQDSQGSSAGAAYTFSVDYTLPAITQAACSGPLNVPPPTAADDCAGVVTATTTNATTFTVSGDYTINWTFTDAAGNVITASQLVSADIDDLPPVPDGGTPEWLEAPRVLAGDINEAFMDGEVTVAISDSFALVGSPYDDDARGTDVGSAYLLRLGGDGRWTPAQTLQANDAAVGDLFGRSVALFDHYALVGATQAEENGISAGAAYLFERGTNGVWQQVAKLLPDDAASGDDFGRSVALGDSLLIVGAGKKDAGATDAGAVYVFEQGGDGMWQQTQQLTVTEGNRSTAHFGASLALDHATLIVGAYAESSVQPSAGAAYIFERDGAGQWQQHGRLVSDDIESSDAFGTSVALSGNYAIVGAYQEASGGAFAGAAYLFERSTAGRWTQQTKLQAADGADRWYYGISVALDQDFAVVGADGAIADDGSYPGAAYVYRRSTAGSWSQVDKIVPEQREDVSLFGTTVALKGNRALFGAYLDKGTSHDGVTFPYRLSYALPTATQTDCGAGPIDPPAPIATDACTGSVTGTTARRTPGDTLYWAFTDAAGNTSLAHQPVTVDQVTFSLPISESAEAGSPTRNCWQVIDNNGDGGWHLASNNWAATGTTAFTLAANTEAAQNDRLQSPPLSLSTGTEYALSFYPFPTSGFGGQLRALLLDGTTGEVVSELYHDQHLSFHSFTGVHLRFVVPETGNYQVAFESTAAADNSADIQIDDISLSVFTPPTDGAADLSNPANDECSYSVATGVVGTAWFRLFGPGNKLVAEINPNGNDLGDVTLQYTDYANPTVAPFTGAEHLSRYFDITPENGAGPYTENGGINVRLYFLEDELTEFNTIRGTTRSWDDLTVTHYRDVNTDCNLTNSTGDDWTLETVTHADYGTTAHYLEFTTTDFSEFGATSTTAAPVTLTDFTARAAGTGNLLQWTVAQEIDLSHYTVEYSTDGTTFATLGNLAGTGHQHYTLTDPSPAPLTYYRLRLVDLDGSYSLSRAVSVQRMVADRGLAVLGTYPVPTAGQVTVHYQNTTSAPVTYKLLDPLGRLLRSGVWPGTGTLEGNVDLGDLHSGTYHLLLANRATSRTIKLIRR